MFIIAFGHRRCTGKDTCSHFLGTKLIRAGYSVRKQGFASKLKQLCYDLYGWAGLQQESYYETHTEDKEIVLPLIGLSPRNIWIKFGTNVVREIYSQSWVNYLLKTKFTEDFLIINDLRFPNEFTAVKEAGGICIKVTRPDAAVFDDVADSALKDFNNWDLEITNNSSKPYLAHQVYTKIPQMQQFAFLRGALNVN